MFCNTASVAETDESVVPMRAMNAGDATMFSKLRAILYALPMASRMIQSGKIFNMQYVCCFGLCVCFLVDLLKGLLIYSRD